MKAQWYDGITGLNELQSAWSSLHGSVQVYGRHEWYVAATTHLFIGSSRVHFCCIRNRDDRPVAIVPAIVERTRIDPYGDLNAVTLGLQDNLVLFDFPLDRDADHRTVAATFLAAVRSKFHDWQVISWSRFADSSNAARIAQAFSAAGSMLVSASPSSVFDTTGDAAVMYARVSSGMRRNLRRYRKRLDALGAVEVRFASECDSLQQFYREFQRIESTGWKGGQGTGSAIACVPEATAFYQTLLGQRGTDFLPDIVLLYIGGQPIAGQILLRSDSWLHVYKIGYDEAFAKCSPGQILLEKVLQHAHASPHIDRVSLVTSIQWHFDWVPQIATASRLTLFREPWRAALIRVARHLKRRVANWRTARTSSQFQGLVSQRPHNGSGTPEPGNEP